MPNKVSFDYNDRKQPVSIPHFMHAEIKRIIYEYNGRKFNFSSIRTNIYPHTIARMLEGGINHFLTYYYVKDEKEYQKLCEHIMRTFVLIRNDCEVKLKDEKNYIKNRAKLLTEYCQLDSTLIKYICEYVKDTSKNDIDVSKSTTTITLRNIHCNILTCLAVAVKFAFVYSSLIIGQMKFDDALSITVDYLLRNIINTAMDYFEDEEGEEITMERLLNAIDYFLFQRTSVMWEKSDASFRQKFEQTGKDTTYYATKNRMSVFVSLKQYAPQLEYDDLISKYSNKKGTKLSDIYFTIEKDYNDFKFINRNLTGYIQNTIDKIVKTQDSKSSVVDVNIPEFIVGSTDERTLRKDYALYEDKTKHLFDLRSKTCTTVFDKFINELERMSEKYNIKDFSIVKQIRLDKKHGFNQFILSKILLCLTGECKVYTMIFGLFSKIFLLLFYYKIKYEPKYKVFVNTVDIMTMDPVSMSGIDKTKLKKFLNDEGFDVHNMDQAFSDICKYYTDDKGNQYELSKEELLDLYEYMSNPSVVRNMLFPTMYKVEPIPELPKKEPDKNIKELQRYILEG